MHRALTAAICSEGGPKPRFLIHLGDLSENCPSSRLWEVEFFQAAEELLKSVPLWPVIGNHEGPEGLFGEFFPGPAARGYYSFDYSMAHFAVVDLTHTPFEAGSPQYRWLIDDLDANSKPWTILCTHRPFLGMNRHGDQPPEQVEFQGLLFPIVERFAIDLVLAGHYHCYQRWGTGGVTYLVSGGATGSYQIDPEKFARCPVARVLAGEPHWGSAEVSAQRIGLVIKGLEGTVLDEFELVKPSGR